MIKIHFIGGEKGGVGKSVVSRLLAQYWLDNEKPWRGYDADLSHGALTRYYNGYSTVLDIDKLESLDELIEQSLQHPDQVSMIDLASQSGRKLHAWLDGIDMEELTAEMDLDLVFWHVMDDGKDSVNLIERLVDTYDKKVSYVVAKNRVHGDNFDLFEKSTVRKKLEAWETPMITIKALHHPIMSKIDHMDKSFWAAVNNNGDKQASLGLMERQRVKAWLRHAYSEFERIGL